MRTGISQLRRFAPQFGNKLVGHDVYGNFYYDGGMFYLNIFYKGHSKLYFNYLLGSILYTRQ